MIEALQWDGDLLSFFSPSEERVYEDHKEPTF